MITFRKDILLISCKKRKKNIILFFFLNDLLDHVLNVLTVSTIC